MSSIPIFAQTLRRRDDIHVLAKYLGDEMIS
jgi:hypothetical protein